VSPGSVITGERQFHCGMYTEQSSVSAATTGHGRTMRAIAQDGYGPPDVLELREVDVPTVGADEVLVRVRAAGANPADWHLMRGDPYVMRLQSGLSGPTPAVRGLDVAGVVESVGDGVTRFGPGDEVFGEADGTFAEYAAAGEDALAPKPAGLTFEEAAAVPVAGITALQGLRDTGGLRSEQSVLINGASGGVGTFAVQVAKAYGAAVTGVCSARNVGLVRSLGAEHVIDYTEEDFARSGERYDLVFDLVGNRSLSDLRRVLAPEGTLVLSGAAGGRWIGPLPTLATALVLSPFLRQRLRAFVASVNAADLADLAGLVEEGAVTPVIDRTYPLEETPEAIRYLEAGHARGKVVITV
jgi:NADPH:quinone reductase-like Zn-dependent oxidoreductase